jgi:cathepsin A (carboxypeptidase C)
VNVGFSYSNDQTVNNTVDAGKDICAFLQLFLGGFREYAAAPFHVAAESYGGMYGPQIASIIHKVNKDIVFAPGSGLKHINLASVVLAMRGPTHTSRRLASPAILVKDQSCL